MNRNIFYAPDGAQGGNPADESNNIDLNRVGVIFAERILGLSKDKQENFNPLYPDSKRMLNFPTVDNSPIDYAGFTNLKDLGTYVADVLRKETEANKLAKNNKPSRFINATVATDKELVNLRIFGFSHLTKPGETDPKTGEIIPHSEQGYVSAGITRQERVKFIGGGVSTYGRTVKDGGAIPETEVKTATVPQAEVKAKPQPTVV